jgi:hypothetical protein
MKKEEPYRVSSHMFKGTNEYEGKIIGYTYEITFNKSLEHTGRFDGIEDGLNKYCKKELKTNVKDNFKRLWYSLLRWFKNL